MSADIEFLKSFQKESLSLIEELLVLLSECENNFSQVKKLEEYGQKIDRIMGGAKTLALFRNDPTHLLNKVGDYTALCKMLAYRAADIKDDEKLYHLCVAALQDATEALFEILQLLLVDPLKDFKEVVPQTLMDRVKWIAAQIGQSDDPNKKTKLQKMNQGEIDDLIKKLGM